MWVRARGTVDRRVEWASARDVGRTAIFFTGPLIFARWCKRAPWRVSEIIFLRARSFPARFALQSGCGMHYLYYNQNAVNCRKLVVNYRQ